MIHEWQQQIEKSGNVPLRLGNRYEVLGFDCIDGGHTTDSHAQYQLRVRNLDNAKETVVPITQIGLPFADRILQAKDIVRANDVLERHHQALDNYRHCNWRESLDRQVSTPPHGPLIVSQAGIGRNAALIAFRDISIRITQEKSVNRDNLDTVLCKLILDSRRARGPKFLHSKNQLHVLRQALLEVIQQTETPLSRPTSGEHVGRRLCLSSAHSSKASPAQTDEVKAVPLKREASDGSFVPAVTLAKSPYQKSLISIVPSVVDEVLPSIEEHADHVATGEVIANSRPRRRLVASIEDENLSVQVLAIEDVGGNEIGSPVNIPRSQEQQLVMDEGSAGLIHAKPFLDSCAEHPITNLPFTNVSMPLLSGASPAIENMPVIVAEERESHEKADLSIGDLQRSQTQQSMRQVDYHTLIDSAPPREPIAEQANPIPAGKRTAPVKRMKRFFASGKKNGAPMVLPSSPRQMHPRHVQGVPENAVGIKRNYSSPPISQINSSVRCASVEPRESLPQNFRRVALDSLGAFPMGTDEEPRFIFSSPLLNMDAIVENFSSPTDTATHRIKDISGANSDCWWRASWLTILLQQAFNTAESVAQVEHLLIKKLGTDCSADARHITSMIDSIRKSGFHSVLSHTSAVHQPRVQDQPSRLKLPHEKNPEENTQGEDVCRRLTHAVLAQSGVPSVELIRSVHGKEPGDASVAATLIHALGFDMALFNNPWKETNYNVRALWVCPQKNSSLNVLDVEGDDPSSLTKELVGKLSNIPIVITHGSHFNLAIPADFYKNW